MQLLAALGQLSDRTPSPGPGRPPAPSRGCLTRTGLPLRAAAAGPAPLPRPAPGDGVPLALPGRAASRSAWLLGARHDTAHLHNKN